MIGLMCMAMPLLHAQKIVEKHLGFSEGKKVVMNIQIADSIRVLTWNKREVYVKASVKINNNRDNEDYLMSFDESGAEIRVKAKFADKENRKNKCNCNCYDSTEIYWDVYIPENAGFSVESINGNIIISGNPAEIKAHSISGFIDLTVSSSRKADIRLNTISGTIYSNLAINTSRKTVGSSIDDRYNGGGKTIDLETISGDIFFRKAD